MLYFVSEKVKRTVGYTKVSRKNQVTLPVAVLRQAHIAQGEELRVEVDGDGRVLLLRETDPLERYIGSMPGLSVATDLEALRDEWER